MQQKGMPLLVIAKQEEIKLVLFHLNWWERNRIHSSISWRIYVGLEFSAFQGPLVEAVRIILESQKNDNMFH